MWYVSYINDIDGSVATGTGKARNEFGTKGTGGEEGRLADSLLRISEF